MGNFWRKDSKSAPASVIRGRFRSSHVLIACVVVGLLFAPQGYVSKTIYRRLGSWLQQHLCESAFGTYSVTGLVLGATMMLALLVPIVAAGFWIRHGRRMVREKTNDLAGRKPLFDTTLIEGPAAVRGGWTEVGAGAFLIVACTFVLLWPMIGAETNVFLRLPAEMEACKATA
jgi:hypothetical protein